MYLIFKKNINYIVNIKQNWFNPYKHYINHVKKEKLPAKTGDNILITNINGAYAGHTFEGLYARKAMLHGITVYNLSCGNCLDYCETIQEMATHKEIRCANCLAQQEEFVKAFGTIPLTYSMFLSEEDKRSVEAMINGFFTSNQNEYKFLGVEIRKILYTALQRHFLIAEPKIQNDKVTRGFLRTILYTLLVMDAAVKKIQPKYVLSSHGIYSTWGPVVEYCKVNGIRVITYGQNYNKCGLLFAYNDSYLTGFLDDAKNEWANAVLPENEKLKAKNFLEERSGKKADARVAFDYNKNNKQRFSRKELCKLLGIDPQKKLVGVFPNIPWDGQVTGKATGFFPFREWLKTTIEYFAKRDDAVLVIRSHPAEVLRGISAGTETTATMLKEMFPKLPDNVILLDPKHKINSYTLGENSDFGIVFSSTVALELTYMKVPIILCGCPPFRNKNIAFDIPSKDGYASVLDKAMRGELVVDDTRIERLLKYIHYYFFQRTMPQTLMDIKDTLPQRYLFNSEKELNEDTVFDEMYRCIENDVPMDFSHFYN